MNLPYGQTYQYSALPSGSSIRLLRILPRPQERISCSLQVVDLNKKPLYDCLSYTWGDPLYQELWADEAKRAITSERKFPISCDEMVIYVTENLHDALSQLVCDGPSSGCQPQCQRKGYIWIDALCIDQENIEEKSQQVAMMCRIYYEAQSVIVWLGGSSLDIETAIRVMDILASISPEKRKVELPEDLEAEELYDILGIPDLELWEWQSFAALFLRTWFSRIWVVQEVFAAQRIEVFCGTYVLKWSDIIAVSETLSETRLGSLLMWNVAETVMPPTDSTRYVDNTINNQIIFHKLREKATPLNLRTLLAYSRYFNATKDQDRVYALLGMWKPFWTHETSSYPIELDYNKSVEDVFTEFSRAAIDEMEDLSLLSLVEDLSFRKRKGLPSWVPDYSVKPISDPLAGCHRHATGEERWKSSDGLKWQTPVWRHPLLLPAQGIHFDTIIESAATEAEISDTHQMYTLLELLTHSLEHSSHNRSAAIDSFWRSLVKNTFCRKPAGEEARRAFPILITYFICKLEDAVSKLREIIEGSNRESEAARPRLAQFSLAHSRTKAMILDLPDRGAGGIIPTWVSVRGIADLRNANNLPAAVVADSEHILQSFGAAYSGRRLFRTRANAFGVAAQSLEQGDEVWVLAGAAVPMVLRQLPNRRRKLVGEAYVHGIMNGETADGMGDRDRKLLGVGFKGVGI